MRNNPAVISNYNEIKKVSAFKKPVLLVKGTGSAKFLHEIIDVLGNYFPNNKIIELPGGHAPQIVSMKQFLEYLEEFQSQAVDK
ncbi:MAG: hypothetical protein EPN82_07255 [Bacteroidetes bacterium]|nr:MAG: hypothetical protein EPN82_07255 [Bacteroidota bacterium]